MDVLRKLFLETRWLEGRTLVPLAAAGIRAFIQKLAKNRNAYGISQLFVIEVKSTSSEYEIYQITLQDVTGTMTVHKENLATISDCSLYRESEIVFEGDTKELLQELFRKHLLETGFTELKRLARKDLKTIHAILLPRPIRRFYELCEVNSAQVLDLRLTQTC